MNRPTIAVICALAGCGSAPAQSVEPCTDQVSGAVIGGQHTPRGQYPATGVLTIDWEGQPRWMCNGTLVAPTAVLTAGHCVSEGPWGKAIPSFALVADANQIVAGDVVAGASVRPHPDLDIRGEAGKRHDIGLLILAEPLDVAPELLPAAGAGAALVAGAEVDIVGYGQAEVDRDEAGPKRHATTHIAEVFDNELLVAREGEPQNCRGDSGGPALLHAGDGERWIVGVVSGGAEPCTTGGFHTRVDAYLPWIRSVLAAHEPDPPAVVKPPKAQPDPQPEGC